MARASAVAWMLLAVCACSGGDEPRREGKQPPTTTSQLEDSDTGFFVPHTTTTTTVTTNMITLKFSEYLSREPIVGADVTLDGMVVPTNANGDAHFPIQPGMVYEATLHPEGHGPMRMVGTMGPWRHVDSAGYPSDDSRALLATMFGSEILPETGIVGISVQAGEPVARFGLADTQVSIDKPSALVLAETRADKRGFVPGDTTIQGQNATIVFAGVEPGTVRPTLVPPDGYTCTMVPETVEVDVGGCTIVYYYCDN